jgi:hypothetical protein
MFDERSLIHFTPVLTTVVAAFFTVALWKHWRRRPQARYLFWWTVGVALFGLGTLTEGATTIFGWSEPLFRSWYIAGALLGGAPLAQGTVYLLMKKRNADRLAVLMLTYAAIVSIFVLATPIVYDLVETHRLSGQVMEWQWVRLFSPLLNTYAMVFLVGGAGWSAWRYRRTSDGPRSRVTGNALIAVGALLPGIGGSFTRAGYVEVLYITEITGLLLIWAGYRAMTKAPAVSVHAAQQTAYATEGK